MRYGKITQKNHKEILKEINIPVLRGENMKKCLSLLLALLLVLLVSPSFAADPVPVTSITLSEEIVEIHVRKGLTLKAVIEPKNATNKKLKWESSDESVATVNNGKVTGKAPGEAVITVTSEDGGLTASCTIHVITPIKKIRFSEKIIRLPVGFSQNVSVIIDPEDATKQDLIWTSSNEDVATVDENGTVTGVSLGSAKITASAQDGSKLKTTIDVKIMEFDLMFNSLENQTAEYAYPSGKSRVRLSIESGCVSVTGVRQEIKWKKKGTTKFTVTPEKPGADVITINAGNVKTVVTVYVCPVITELQALQHTYRYLNGLPLGTTWGETQERFNKTILLRSFTLNDDGTAVLNMGSREMLDYTPDSVKYYYRAPEENAISDTDKYQFFAARFHFKVPNSLVMPNHFLDSFTEEYGKYAKGANTTTHILNYCWKTDEMIITLAKRSNEEMAVYFEWMPTDILEATTSLTFSNVSRIDNSKMKISDPFYLLETLSPVVSAIDSNAISFSPKNIKDWSTYSSLTFYIDDMQDGNEHTVTIIDSSGNRHSEQLSGSKYVKWMRIDVPLAVYGQYINLSEIAEIRIGEREQGSYIIFHPCLVN